MWGHIPRDINKMIYIRDVSSTSSDTNQTTSVCFPISAMRGISYVSATLVTLWWEAPYQYVHADNDNCDGAIIQVTAIKPFVTELVEAISMGDSYFINIVDEVTGERFASVVQCTGITSNVGAD